MNAAELDAILERAGVPEHSVAFMRAMSGGEAFLVDSYLFIAGDDWLVAIGYPLSGDYSHEGFQRALADALRQTRAVDCWAIAPSLPARLRDGIATRDQYYVLPADAPVPRRLKRLAQRASESLRVDEGVAFTAEHRRLWAEFLGRVSLPPHVRELYARTERVLSEAPGLVLLNAWDPDGHLAACMLLDTAPRHFLSYLVGAHSRIHYTRHASDLLFSEMIRIARRHGKEFLHLGLGVNDGIRRFKSKWGAKPALPYEMAAWQERPGLRAGADELMRMLASTPAEAMSKRQYMASLPQQRRFAMLWEAEMNGRRSLIGGTAHFFCYSFEHSLRGVLEQVDTVLFEGPLDQGSLDRVSDIGRAPHQNIPRLIDFLTHDEIRSLEKVVCGPRGRLARILGLHCPEAPDVRFYLSETRHWMAFFSLWAGFLSRKGWTQSVDLEAWHLAWDMGKHVMGMESIEEQIETLESIPVARIVNFFRQCRLWNGYIRRNARAYLKGDLDAMMGTSIEFPSRTETVINRRDARFVERMKPFLQEGRCAVFVGSAHMFTLPQMLAESGFNVRKLQ